MVAPKIEARFLEDQGMYRRFFQDRRPNLDPKNPRPLPESDPFKVGKYYRITHGVFKGVRGVIVATFKTHIDVCVFNNKIERI
jgi:transcription antitermination factor NusG